MAKTTFRQTNWTGGELSPRIEGRSDLSKFFNGASIIENFLVFPQGGVPVRPGTRYAGAVKTASKKTRLIPFEFNIEQAYILEFGEYYIRFWADGAQIEVSAGVPYEVTTTYTETEVFALQFRQSADVLYLVHPDHAPAKLSRLSDTSWALANITFLPPPTYEADTDLIEILTPAATTGTGINFVASSGVFLAGDVGRQIIYGASKAGIISVTDPTTVVADIIDDFPDTDPIAAGDWTLRGSPQTELDPHKKGILNQVIDLDTNGVDAFRSADVGKYIKVLGGILKITIVSSAQAISAQVLSIMSQTEKKDPDAVIEGAWTLEVDAWSAALGYPSTIEFHDGRLGFGGNAAQPTTFWLSRSQDYENMGLGVLADDGIEYTIASRQVNVIQWMASFGSLILGDARNEHVASGSGVDEPLGGDTIPRVVSQSAKGSAALQPLVLSDSVVFIQRAKRKIYATKYDLTTDKIEPVDLTAFSEHITAPSLADHPLGYASEPYSQIMALRSDGQLVLCTYNPEQEVVAWYRYVTQGTIESFAVIPHPDGDRDQIWISVARVLSSGTKRYIEIFDDNAPEMSAWGWQSLHLDSAVVYSGVETDTITGLGHLEGLTARAVADGAYKGEYTVVGGQITLPDTFTVAEVGLSFIPKLVTMRPAPPDHQIDGYQKGWTKIFLRVLNSIGVTVNGEEALFNVGGQPMDTGPPLYTGDQPIPLSGSDPDGYITITQDQPYPLTILALFGDLDLGGR